jgi:hypothetical protein
MAETKPRSTSQRARSRGGGTTRARSNGAQQTARRGAQSAESGANGVVGTVTETLGSATGLVAKLRGPLVAGGAAAAGAIGGAVLGARLRPRKSVLGIPVPRKGVGFQPMTRELRNASQQLGRVVDEVAKARQQAERVGKALS